MLDDASLDRWSALRDRYLHRWTISVERCYGAGEVGNGGSIRWVATREDGSDRIEAATLTELEMEIERRE